jgi:hypothetical protein
LQEASNMSDKLISITEDQLTSMFSKAMESAVKAARAPGVLEQKAIDKQIEDDKRRDMAMRSLAKIEEEAIRRKRDNCSHSRYSMAAGALGGHDCAKGKGEWTTGGQLSGRNDKTGAVQAVLVCTRCSRTFRWEPTVQELDYFQNGGSMLGYPPPSEDRLVLSGSELVGA